MYIYTISYRKLPTLHLKIPWDWSSDPFETGNGCHHFFSLRWLPQMIENWKEKPNENPNPLYILNDFLSYHSYPENPVNKFYLSRRADHTASIRLGILIDFWNKGKFENNIYNIDKQLLKNEIEKHIAIMSSDKIYRFPNNHGLMMDHALITASLTAPEFDTDKIYFNIGEKRAKKQIEHMFDDFGFTKEHSLVYQAYNASICIDLLNTYKKHNLATDLTERIYQIIATSHYFLRFSKRPDGLYPPIGDSFREWYKSNNNQVDNIEKTLNNAPKHIQNRSKKYWDEVEQNGFLVAPKAGFAVIRDQHGPDPIKDSSHIFFTASWHSRTHKQNDDLSFTFFTDGISWIDDPGYSDQATICSYRKEEMHNVLTNITHKWSKTNSIKSTHITKYFNQSKLHAIQGKHSRIKYTTVTRTLVYISPSILIVIDNVQTQLNTPFCQKFHFSPDITPTLTSYGDVLCSHSKHRCFCGVMSLFTKNANKISIEDSYVINTNGTMLPTKSAKYIFSHKNMFNIFILQNKIKNSNFFIRDIDYSNSNQIIVSTINNSIYNDFIFHLKSC
ncbi:MAG: heparinase II/III domain-containing protein [bacterium]